MEEVSAGILRATRSPANTAISTARACILLALMVWASAWAADAPLSVPSKSASFPGAFNKVRSFPVSSNGYLVSFTRISSNATGPNLIQLVSLETGEKKLLQLDLHRSTTLIADASVSPSGLVFVVGSYVRADGSIANFLAKLDPAGETSALNDLADYSAEKICAATDGSVWTFGERQQSSPGTHYDTLREYTADGSLKGSWLDRAILGGDLGQPGAESRAILTCGQRSVGVYTAYPGSARWTELQLSTGVAQTDSVTPVTKARITGLSLLGPGQVYASVVRQGTLRGLYRLAVTGSSIAEWVPVNTGATNFSRLVGRDGPNLVYYTTAAVPGNPVLYWSKP